jgi:uncharacterized damage-inducible protein DinB
MQVIPLLLKEMEQEAEVTRKMLKLVPEDKFDWKPHEKSMPMKILAVHLAELPSWVAMGLSTSEMDFQNSPYKPTEVSNTDDIVALFDKSLAAGVGSLKAAKEEDLLPNWTLRSGDQVFNVFTKYEVIRHAFAQTAHHRAQLGVYLRLLNIPIPGTYGPSADDQSF